MMTSRSASISAQISAAGRGKRRAAMWLLCGANLMIILDS